MTDFYTRRREDTVGFIKRNWQLLSALVAVISWISTLAWSVKNHHDIDEVRCAYMSQTLRSHGEDIAMLKQAVLDIKESNKDTQTLLKQILDRMPSKR